MPKKKIKEDIELDFEENEIKYSEAKRKAKKYNNMLKKAQNFMSNRLDDIEELMAFYEGSQYKLATYENNKPWVVQMNTPHASVNIDIRVSSLVALDYVGVLEPYSPDDKDKVDVLQSIIEDLWGEMDLNSKITKAIHTGAIIREGYIHIMYDSKKIKGGKNRRMKGQIEAYPLDTAHVWLDPEARTFEDCNYIAVTERPSKNIVYKKYPFLKGRLNGSAFSPSQRGEIFANNDYTTEQDDVVTKVIMYVKEYNDTADIARMFLADFFKEINSFDYLEEIYEYLKSIDSNNLPLENYMETVQNDITEKMRSILLDWLVEVHLKFKLLPETFYLTVNIIDRYLSKQSINRKYLQLLGVTAMFIACKYEEIYSPEIKDFIYMTDNAYTREQMIKMEFDVLKELEFNITNPSPLRFVEILKNNLKFDEKNFFLCQFFLESCITNYKMIKYSPNILATCTVYIAEKFS